MTADCFLEAILPHRTSGILVGPRPPATGQEGLVAAEESASGEGADAALILEVRRRQRRIDTHHDAGFSDGPAESGHECIAQGDPLSIAGEDCAFVGDRHDHLLPCSEPDRQVILRAQESVGPVRDVLRFAIADQIGDGHAVDVTDIPLHAVLVDPVAEVNAIVQIDEHRTAVGVEVGAEATAGQCVCGIDDPGDGAGIACSSSCEHGKIPGLRAGLRAIERHDQAGTDQSGNQLAEIGELEAVDLGIDPGAEAIAILLVHQVGLDIHGADVVKIDLVRIEIARTESLHPVVLIGNGECSGQGQEHGCRREGEFRSQIGHDEPCRIFLRCLRALGLIVHAHGIRRRHRIPDQVDIAGQLGQAHFAIAAVERSIAHLDLLLAAEVDQDVTAHRQADCILELLAIEADVDDQGLITPNRGETEVREAFLGDHEFRTACQTGIESDGVKIGLVVHLERGRNDDAFEHDDFGLRESPGETIHCLLGKDLVQCIAGNAQDLDLLIRDVFDLGRNGIAGRFEQKRKSGDLVASAGQVHAHQNAGECQRHFFVVVQLEQRDLVLLVAVLVDLGQLVEKLGRVLAAHTPADRSSEEAAAEVPAAGLFLTVFRIRLESSACILCRTCTSARTRLLRLVFVTDCHLINSLVYR